MLLLYILFLFLFPGHRQVLVVRWGLLGPLLHLPPLDFLWRPRQRTIYACFSLTSIPRSPPPPSEFPKFLVFTCFLFVVSDPWFWSFQSIVPLSVLGVLSSLLCKSRGHFRQSMPLSLLLLVLGYFWSPLIACYSAQARSSKGWILVVFSREWRVGHFSWPERDIGNSSFRTG